MLAIFKLIITFLVLIISFLMGVGVMINGWGLRAESWGWIIGGAVFQMALYGFIGFIAGVREK